jgi:hypothetical protein
MSEPFVQTRLSAPPLGEGLRAEYPARPPVRDTEDHSPAALVGEGDAVLHELVEVEPARSRLELDPTPLRALEQRAELVGRRHSRASGLHGTAAG